MPPARGSTFLVQAVRGGCVGLLQDLTEGEVGQRDEYGFTALMYNALLYEEILDPMLLKEAGTRSNEGKFAFLYALEKQHFSIAEALVATEGLLADSHGCPSIIYAIRHGCEKLALRLWRMLMSNGTHPHNIVTGDAKTLCMWVAEYGMLALLQECLKADGVLYATYCDLHGRTALMYAARAGHKDCVRELRFFCPLARDCDGMNALMHAAQRGNADCVEVLLTGYASMLDTSMTCVEEHNTDVNLFLGMQDNTGRTALHYAIFAASPPCIRLLIRERGILDVHGYSGGLYLFKNSILQMYLRLMMVSKKCDDVHIVSIISVEYVIHKIREHLVHKSREFQRILYTIIDILFSALMGDNEFSRENEGKERTNYRLRTKHETPIQEVGRCAVQNLESIFDYVPIDPSILCCVCNVRLSSYVFYPCRHACTCSVCVSTIEGSCPLCSKTIYHADRMQLEGE
ncbi:Protein 21.1 [Giardia lamblia P15]|uniref:Protein 21.1 n=1 Tax=Giardia intestinalis (strain P15) TaxID=658858 RepID=E1EXK9_GIAIA|nr:Protein 21.1 [Giardia lamblia P15]